MLGDHGLYLKHPIPYEGLLRVGLIVRGPGVQRGAIVDEPVSTLDLPATFCDYAGTTLDDDAQSNTLRPLLEGQKGASRDVAYSEWYVNASRCGVPLSLHTVRTKQAKLTMERQSGAGELYDLRDDPDEMQNRFDDPAYAGLRKDLEGLIEDRPGAVMETFDEPVGMA